MIQGYKNSAQFDWPIEFLMQLNELTSNYSLDILRNLDDI